MAASGQDGYTTTAGVPPSGDLPHTGADIGLEVGAAAGLLFLGAALWASVSNVRRTARPTPAAAPAYLRDKTGRDPDDPRYNA